MTVTLTLSPEEATRLRDALGREDAEGIGNVLLAAGPQVVRLLSSETPVARRGEMPRGEELERLLDRLAQTFEAAMPPDFVPLPDEALTREAIYADHD